VPETGVGGNMMMVSDSLRRGAWEKLEQVFMGSWWSVNVCCGRVVGRNEISVGGRA